MSGFLPENLLKNGTLLVATHNAGKAREMEALLAPLGLRLTTLAEAGLAVPEEIHDTFRANALLKAEHAGEATGMWVLADDSGLEVDALGGKPGVFTADYGGFERLLTEMAAVPEVERGASFRCVLALRAPEGEHRFFEGTCRGTIARTPAGNGGFGYDPVFLPEGETRTFAEMTKEEKAAFSHRGQALRALLDWLGA